jgi:hypothetical protein
LSHACLLVAPLVDVNIVANVCVCDAGAFEAASIRGENVVKQMY